MFDFVPKVAMIFHTNNWQYYCIAGYGAANVRSDYGGSTSGCDLTVTWNNYTMSWYNYYDTSGYKSLNSKGDTYKWIAIG